MPDIRDLGDRSLGVAVTNARSSWVRKLCTDLGTVFIKNYEYATWRDRLRDFAGRTGPWTRSRATREFDALAWMRARGLAAPEPLAALEDRCLGFLRRATLVTVAFPGETTADLLPRLSPEARHHLAEEIGRLVGRLHALGFRDRNLDLRNLLAHHSPAGWIVAKIDSPRHRLRASGRRTDALTRADWQRLSPQLDAFGLTHVARRAADAE
ncbi:MAG: lipopolysaccharide kinase InaA family protein [Planctomycetota bacterium]